MKKLMSIFTLFVSFYAFASDEISTAESFGDNPGNLTMNYYLNNSGNTTEKNALVVILHGCGQTAKEYAEGTGWLKLAQENGFNLLIPGTNSGNNNLNCFNWFERGDILRGNGESKSIENMIMKLVREHNSDRDRVFVTGLSAGGVMANALLANYPDLFAGGAIVAGIPYGCAFNQTAAWMCMSGFQWPSPSAQERGDAVRSAYPNNVSEYPRILIFHGSSDEVVNYNNARYLVEQWTNVHNISQAENTQENQESYNQISFGAESKVSLITIPGMKHGQPVDLVNGCGVSGKYFLDVGVCSAELSAKFFNLK